jgi:hypothetical protein
MNDTPQIPGVYLGFFANDTCIYVTDRKESYVLRKMQRGLTAIETWYEHWNIKINKDKTQTIYFSHRFRLNASQVGFRARHSTTLHYIWLTDHITLNFNLLQFYYSFSATINQLKSFETFLYFMLKAND